MSKRNFARLAAYIFDYSGIKMPDSKKTMLEGRLRRRQRATGARTLDEYCDYIFADENLAREGLSLINAVTTNKTDFFREPGHFEYLSKVVLPELGARGVRTIRAWSAACSTGPEPYTLAMVLDDHAETHDGPAYGILATDLDTDVLETARSGIYPRELVDPVPDALQRKYVMSSRDPARRDVRMVPALRSAIGFARLNLMDDRYPVGEPMHLIFCRNVLIYFDKPTQRKVVSQLVDCLKPRGHLFLGHSESITGHDLPLTQVANTVFRKA
ncbi:protein-glutamate O-methyltransferase CheR [Novosphingobium sp. RL4]|uniref:CheR family methyltransferase n=1 Tax=Novosphingobium sp. RL4 TaxID=3109595 RepID=UPI002D7903F9|nr:protein-glutamate O-methyltransferase CheR [Novosphingobium sp. RL4]WRT96156.1 protein-glutamate O-methyltransferase CheR [Novosphingobium sp. RL4]